MALGRPEKLPSHSKPGKWRKYSKRSIHRKRRQLERQNAESAPKKIGFYGWSD